MKKDLVVLQLDNAIRSLQEAKTIQETKKVLDIATAAEVYAKRQKLGEEAEHYALNIKIEALRKLGEQLKESEKAKPGPKKIDSKSELNYAPTLKEMGIDLKTSMIAQRLNELPEEQIESIKDGQIAMSKAIKEYKSLKEKKKRIANEQDLRQKNSDVSCEIINDDFRIHADKVKEFDAIITDPPYPHEFISCFSDLSLFAKNSLKEDGYLAVYSGQFHLPEVIKRLSEHMEYVWTFCLYHSGKKQLVNGINLMCGWKPVLIFRKSSKKKFRFSGYDVLVSDDSEKDRHKWQQSESGILNLVELLTLPGDKICDPFAGSATFLKVARDLKRHSIGFEIDKSHYEKAIRYLND